MEKRERFILFLVFLLFCTSLKTNVFISYVIACSTVKIITIPFTRVGFISSSISCKILFFLCDFFFVATIMIFYHVRPSDFLKAF